MFAAAYKSSIFSNSVGEAEGDRLLAQVGQLPAGDLVVVHAAGRGRAVPTRTACRRGARPPSTARGRRPPAATRPVSRSVWARAATSAEADGWLVVPAIGALATSTASAPARLAASSVASWPPAVSWVCTWTGRSKLVAERFDELFRRAGAQQPRHVLDREDVGAGFDDLLGQPQVVVERVQVFGRVEQVAGVAERHLGDAGAGGEHRVDGRAHLGHVVEGVEDAEDVDAGGGGLAHERIRHLGGVRACSRRCCGRAAASGSRRWAAPRAATPSRSQGSSARNRSATS